MIKKKFFKIKKKKSKKSKANRKFTHQTRGRKERISLWLKEAPGFGLFHNWSKGTQTWQTSQCSCCRQNWSQPWLGVAEEQAVTWPFQGNPQGPAWCTRCARAILHISFPSRSRLRHQKCWVDSIFSSSHKKRVVFLSIVAPKGGQWGFNLSYT